MQTVPELWARYRTAFSQVQEALQKSVSDTTGTAPSPPPASTAAFHALVAYCASESVPEAGALPLDTHAIACAFVNEATAVLGFVLAREGLRRAVEVLVCAHEWKAERTRIGRHATAATDPWLMTEMVVRPALLAADGATFAECLAYAKEKWPAAVPAAKAALSHLFPKERAWSEEVVASAIVESKARRPGSYGLIVNLVRSVADIALVEKLVLETGTVVDLGEVWERFGTAALPLILKIVEAPRQSHELKGVARVLRKVGTPEVARVFAESIQHAPMRKVATDYFHEFPELAGPLRERAEGTTRAAKFAQEIVSQLTRSETVLGDEASLADLPAVLASPPWRAKKRPARKRIVVPDLALLPREESFQMTQLNAESLGRYRPQHGVEMTDAEAEAWLSALPLDGALTLADKATQKRIPLRWVLRAWNERPAVEGTSYIVAWVLLSEFRLEMLPGLARWAEEVADSAWVLEPFATMDSPRLAVACARHLRTPRASAFAWRWLSLHPETALTGLIPTAVGEAGPRREAAELALRRLAAKGHAEKARAIADQYGESARASVEEILAWDPLLDCPKAAPKLPPLFRPAAFTRPRLADGRALPVEAVTALGEMLKFTPVDPAYAGIAAVREACDPRSLAELAWDMARAWEIAGGKASEAWMCDALIHLADDEVVRRTTPAIKNGRILSVLEKIGTDAAIMELATIAARAASGRNSVYYANASLGEAQLLRIARVKGITLEELDESVTPTLGMDAEGGLTLDYGARSVRVGFDEALSPFFQVDGERVRALPVKRKTDDAAKVKAAKQIWDELREDVGVIADRRIRAMERAMVSGRRWDIPTFRATWIDHPLMIHLARGVVWHAGDGTTSWWFRVAEDKTFSDENDATIDLSRATFVEIAHPLDLGEERVARLSRLFSDYELIQPFAQLSRDAPRLTAAESSALAITRPRAAGPAQKLSSALLATGRWRQEQSRPQFRMRHVFQDEETYADATFDDVGPNVSMTFWKGGVQLAVGSVRPVTVAECMRDCEMSRA